MVEWKDTPVSAKMGFKVLIVMFYLSPFYRIYLLELLNYCKLNYCR